MWALIKNTIFLYQYFRWHDACMWANHNDDKKQISFITCFTTIESIIVQVRTMSLCFLLLCTVIRICFNCCYIKVNEWLFLQKKMCRHQFFVVFLKWENQMNIYKAVIIYDKVLIFFPNSRTKSVWMKISSRLIKGEGNNVVKSVALFIVIGLLREMNTIWLLSLHTNKNESTDTFEKLFDRSL